MSPLAKPSKHQTMGRPAFRGAVSKPVLDLADRQDTIDSNPNYLDKVKL